VVGPAKDSAKRKPGAFEGIKCGVSRADLRVAELKNHGGDA